MIAFTCPSLLQSVLEYKDLYSCLIAITSIFFSVFQLYIFKMIIFEIHCWSIYYPLKYTLDICNAMLLPSIFVSSSQRWVYVAYCQDLGWFSLSSSKKISK